MFNLIAIVFMAATGNADVYALDHGMTERDCNERHVSSAEIVAAGCTIASTAAAISWSTIPAFIRAIGARLQRLAWFSKPLRFAPCHRLHAAISATESGQTEGSSPQ